MIFRYFDISIFRYFDISIFEVPSAVIDQCISDFKQCMKDCLEPVAADEAENQALGKVVDTVAKIASKHGAKVVMISKTNHITGTATTIHSAARSLNCLAQCSGFK